MNNLNNWDKVRKVLVDLSSTAFEERPNICEEYNGDCYKCPYQRYCRMNSVLDTMVVNIMNNDPKTPMGVQMLIHPQAQEVVEKCLGYFWDRLVEEGYDNPDIEYLCDDLGITEDELKKQFNILGYEEE